MSKQPKRSIEERLQILEDERELRDLLARYSFNADLGRAQEYAELYTEDGAIDLRDMGSERFVGHDALRDDFLSSADVQRKWGRMLHHAAPTVFHIDGDDAEAEGYSITINKNDDGTITIGHANYSHWTFRREDGAWKIVERDIRLFGSPEGKDMIRLTSS